MSFEVAGQSSKNVNGKTWIASQDYLDLIAANKVPGHFSVHKFGYNSAVGTTEEVIWTDGNGYSYLSAAEVLKVSSDDANDDGDPAGTGARTVTIEGLDSSWIEQSETITLNGTTAVATSNSYLRVFRAYVVASGSGGVNAGLISINDNADTVTLAEIVAGRGQTQMALWTVPAGHTLFVTNFRAAENNTKKVRVRFYARDNALSNPSWRIQAPELVVNSSSESERFPIPLRFTEKSDIEIRGEEQASGGGDVNASFDGYYET
jgi:hypothetical protein